MRELQSGASSELVTRRSAAFESPFVSASILTALGGIVTAVLVAMFEPKLLLFVAAILCGWAELAGACGMSHMATFTPVRRVHKNVRLWLRLVALYTLGGLATSAVVGLTLGLVGDTLPFRSRVLQGVVVFISVVLVGQALGRFRFVLPQVWRQTNKLWALEYGLAPAAAMWGAHIGVGFATVIAHGGIFVIAFAAANDGPLMGALLFMTFWIGRTLPLWILPGQLRDDWDAIPRVVDAFPYLRGVAAVGMSIAVIALVNSWAWI